MLFAFLLLQYKTHCAIILGTKKSYFGEANMKITCLGDSIRMQYAPRVAELLGEDFEVFAPAENCRFAKYTLRGLFDWKSKMEGSRIVHWNNGLWDICNLFGDGLFTSEQEYLDNMLRIADILLARYDKVIFATMTPVTERNKYNKNSDIERYNALVSEALSKKGIIINDLYSLVAADIDRYISSDEIHLSDEGIELCANQVAKVILDAARGISDSDKKCDESISDEESGAPVIFEK
jgi:lysophospholipase L1-like esterase